MVIKLNIRHRTFRSEPKPKKRGKEKGEVEKKEKIKWKNIVKYNLPYTFLNYGRKIEE